MKITRFTQDTVNKSILKSVECEECRNKIETYDIYTIGLSINKKDGKGMLLCGDCARKLNKELDKTIK